MSRLMGLVAGLSVVTIIAGIVAGSNLVTTIDSGTVGVKKSFSGVIQPDYLMPGWNPIFFHDVYKVTTKEIPIELKDLKPTAADNIQLEDFDTTIYYTISPSASPKMLEKYQTLTLVQDKTHYIGYIYIEKLATSAANEVISTINSMNLNKDRSNMERLIKEKLQSDLDANDNGAFKISNVNITSIIPNKSVSDSIKRIAESENAKKVAENELEIAKKISEKNIELSKSLDAKILAEKQLDAMVEIGKHGNSVYFFPIEMLKNGNVMMQAAPHQKNSAAPTAK